MRLYLLLDRLRLPLGYAGKFFLVAFVATHLPLVAAVLLLLREGRPDWTLVGVLLAATVAGLALAVAGIHALLAPVRESTRALGDFAVSGALPELPLGHADTAGRLMGVTQGTLAALDTALTAARGAQREALEAARRRERAMTEVTHELRTPLNAVLGFAELLQMQAHGPLGHRRYAEFAEDIAEGGRHMLALIEDVQRFSALREGRESLRLGPVEIGVPAQRAARLLRAEAAARGVEIAVRVPPGLSAMADPQSLLQILLNLVGNAAKYAGRGSHVAIEAAREGGQVVVRVTDDGAGMDEPGLRLAMEPFGRLSNTPERGTGLGLPLASALVELQGGRFVLESVPGQGTTAHFTLPAPRRAG
ncbi:sensor histidine kinase [Roseomonas nepalensis]|uniref:histidine kinase n=1 Tax=Muricoccus nepalensis TaxID=1854500 RepID=A0A502GDZ5_9PROT|nr:HAMP domain-containing sensor histidine kinase [Roseomonas nepalensis]TPG59540.1 sensor histidine kinase [Roseomonas nepalensis]